MTPCTLSRLLPCQYAGTPTENKGMREISVIALFGALIYDVEGVTLEGYNRMCDSEKEGGFKNPKKLWLSRVNGPMERLH